MNDKSEEKICIDITDPDVYTLYSYTAVGNTMAITLEKAIKEKVNLTRAGIYSIFGTTLDGVDLTNGKMNGCTFSDCSMVGAKFDGTSCLCAKFTYVNMDRAIITNQNLYGWKFKTSKLTNIDFGELDLTRCDFDGVDFAGSDLSTAKYHIDQFEYCYMDGAKMNPNPAPSELVECGKPIKPVDLANPN